MAVYIGHDECRVIYVAKNGQQLRVSSVWVGDQQVFPPANREEIHVFTRDTQTYSRYDYGTHFGFTVPVPWWATSMDVVIIGAGEKGRDGTKSFLGGSDGAGGKSGAWVVKTVPLTQSADAIVYVGKGTSTSPHATEIILPGVGGQADVRVHDGEGTRTSGNGSTGGSVTPRTRTEYDQTHTGGTGGSRDNAGGRPGGGGGGGKGSNLIGNPSAGRNGGDGYVWLRFRSAPTLDPGDERFILRVGVTSGVAYSPLRAWAVGIGKTYQTITEVTVPMEVIGPSLESLFHSCSSLVTIPELDTSQVTTMQSMFSNCRALTTIPALDTSQVTNMRSMFYSCPSLASVPALDTSQVTTMRTMFYACRELPTIPALDTSQVTDMEGMFYDCRALASVPALDTSQVTNTKSMFYNCSSLESVTLPGLGPALASNQTLDLSDTALSPDAANALMSSLGEVTPGRSVTLRLPEAAQGADVSLAEAKGWTVQVLSLVDVLYLTGKTGTESRDQFRAALAQGGLAYNTIASVPFAIDTSGATTTNGLFDGCSRLVQAPQLDMAGITDARNMFRGASRLQTVSALDTSGVTLMSGMFDGCANLTTVPTINASSATNLASMFKGCESLEPLNITNAQNVQQVNGIVSGCRKLTNLTIHGLGSSIASGQILDVSSTRLQAVEGNNLFDSLGTVPSGRTATVHLNGNMYPNENRATRKGWSVTRP